MFKRTYILRVTLFGHKNFLLCIVAFDLLAFCYQFLCLCSSFSFTAQTLNLTSNPVLFLVNHNILPISGCPDKCFRESSTGPQANFGSSPVSA